MLVTDNPTAVPATENQAEDIAAARGVRYRIVLERDVLEQTSQAELVAVSRVTVAELSAGLAASVMISVAPPPQFVHVWKNPVNTPSL